MELTSSALCPVEILFVMFDNLDFGSSRHLSDETRLSVGTDLVLILQDKEEYSTATPPEVLLDSRTIQPLFEDLQNPNKSWYIPNFV